VTLQLHCVVGPLHLGQNSKQGPFIPCIHQVVHVLSACSELGCSRTTCLHGYHVTGTCALPSHAPAVGTAVGCMQRAHRVLACSYAALSQAANRICRNE
jgi:hypothetical protein